MKRNKTKKPLLARLLKFFHTRANREETCTSRESGWVNLLTHISSRTLHYLLDNAGFFSADKTSSQSYLLDKTDRIRG